MTSSPREPVPHSPPRGPFCLLSSRAVCCIILALPSLRAVLPPLLESRSLHHPRTPLLEGRSASSPREPFVASSSARSPLVALLGNSKKSSVARSEPSVHLQRSKTPVLSQVASTSSVDNSGSESAVSSVSTVLSAEHSVVAPPPVLPADSGHALLSLLQRLVATPAAVPAIPVPPVTSLRSPAPIGSLPYHFSTPWDERSQGKFIDGARKLIPKIGHTIGLELSLSDAHTSPYLNMALVTSSGALALKNNDLTYANLKLSKSAEKGQAPTGPSITPMLAAARRTAPVLWDATKLAEYALAAVDYALMLNTLVNPVLTGPFLVMLRHTLSVASGEHPLDWPHAVRFFETEMQNAIDPSAWPQLLETLAPDIRRAGLDAKQPKVTSAPAPDPVPAVARHPQPQFQDYAPAAAPKPQLRTPLRAQLCKNWNRGNKCVLDAEGFCAFTHRCIHCTGDHSGERCPQRPQDRGNEDYHHDRNRDDRHDRHDRNRVDDRRPRR